MWEGIVSGAVTVALGVLAWRWFQREKRTMEVVRYSSRPLLLKGGRYRSNAVRVRNTGNKALKEINLEVQLGHAKAESIALVNQLISGDVEASRDVLGFTISMLNPGELTGVDVTTDDHEIVGAVARAEDVTAVESNSPARSRNREIFKSLAVGIGLGAATIGAGLIGMNFLDRPRIERQIDQAMRGRGMSREEAELFVSDNAEWTIRDDKKRATQQELDKKRVTEAQEAETKKRAEAEAREKREPDRDLIVYWCFRRAGLGREYATLVSGRHIVTYLDAAFYLWDLGEQESAKAEAAINALRLLLNSGEMLPSSKATIYFAMGKIEETRKNDAKSTEYLNLSRQTAEETFSFLATGTR